VRPTRTRHGVILFAVSLSVLALIGDAAGMAAGHRDVPWKKFLSSRTVWLLWLQYYLISYPFYFYLTWLPTYLLEARHLGTREASRFAVFPLLFAGSGSLVIGLLSARVARWTGSVGVGRRLVGSVGCLVAGLFMLLHARLDGPLAAMLVMGGAAFFTDITVPGSWGVCMDIGGKYAGTLSGSMNMMGSLGSLTAPIAMGYILRWTGGNWTVCVYSMAAAYLLASLCWPLLDPVTPLVGSRNDGGR
jgi:sugar phosphate permease